MKTCSKLLKVLSKKLLDLADAWHLNKRPEGRFFYAPNADGSKLGVLRNTDKTPPAWLRARGKPQSVHNQFHEPELFATRLCVIAPICCVLAARPPDRPIQGRTVLRAAFLFVNPRLGPHHALA